MADRPAGSPEFTPPFDWHASTARLARLTLDFLGTELPEKERWRALAGEMRQRRNAIAQHDATIRVQLHKDHERAARQSSLDDTGLFLLADLIQHDHELRRGWAARDASTVVRRLHDIGAGAAGPDAALRVRGLGLASGAGRIIAPMLRSRKRVR